MYAMETYQAYFKDQIHQPIMVVFIISLMTFIGHSILSRLMLASRPYTYITIIKEQDEIEKYKFTIIYIIESLMRKAQINNTIKEIPINYRI